MEPLWEREVMVPLAVRFIVAGKVYLAREKRSKYVVAIKAIEMKIIVRAGIVDLLQNEIVIQSHLMSNPLGSL